VILCVGETLEQHDLSVTIELIRIQIRSAMFSKIEGIKKIVQYVKYKWLVSLI
jgi:triosephosphate isomerase